jgi:hypothetical protein
VAKSLKPKPAAPEANDQPENATAAAWAARADELADWVLAHVVNCTDHYRTYLPLALRAPECVAVARRGTLTRERIARHFRGGDIGDLIGLDAASPDHTCRWVCIDIGHQGPRDRQRRRANRKAAIQLHDRARDLGFNPLLTSSDGHGGYPLLVLFDPPTTSRIASEFGQWLVRDWQTLGLAERPETFPKQLWIGGKVKFGSWARLPGRHHTRDWWSRVWIDGHWASGAEAVDAVLRTRGRTPGLIPVRACPHSTGRQRVRLSDREQPIDRVLSRLDNVLNTPTGWSARCPAHRDRQNSLSVGVGDDGRVLLYCHAGCDIEEIVEAMDLSMPHLFARHERQRRVRYNRKKER